MSNRKAEPLSVGLYEQLITDRLARVLERAPAYNLRTARESLGPATADRHLARGLYKLIAQVLAAVPQHSRPRRQVEIYNAILESLRLVAPEMFSLDDERVPGSPELLLAVLEQGVAASLGTQAPIRPTVPLGSSALLVNGQGEPSFGVEIGSELESADRVDLLCAFLKWHGVRVIRDPLERFFRRDGKMRIVTTTYMGATERRALDLLVNLGAEVSVSYDSRSTRLHAKAWLFHRNSGYSTAYIGSSNLSRAALLDGLEWNVRVSAVDLPEVMAKFRATFDSYWEDVEFERYAPERDAKRFDHAVAIQHGVKTLDTAWLEVHPYRFQREILEALNVERERHNRWRNLVVAATGTGKTVIAAFDFQGLQRRWPGARLLFVAHRKEILQQSLAVFRQVLRDATFGELYVGGVVPTEWKHVFASIQSLHALGPSKIIRDHFDVVIVDEFHHAEAATYKALLTHLAPRALLGLTATPERADGRDVVEWFGGRVAVQLRLWEAIERGLLCPFHYFGIADNVDLHRLRWKRGGYDLGELEKLYTDNDARLLLVIDALKRNVADIHAMRALGFCVSIAHARYMASGFERAGIRAVAVSAESSSQDRENALQRLRDRELSAVFAVDLFNEGVDVPAVDTIMFLRPTESATVFLQQLGRGLRRCEDKACLTVLDFIGQQHQQFRFDLRFKALGIEGSTTVESEIRSGFRYLPAGCRIVLDRVTQAQILENVRSALRQSRSRLVAELRATKETTLGGFLRSASIELEEVYRGPRGGWSQLKRDAGLHVPAAGPAEERLRRAIQRMLHIDDDERLDFYAALVDQGAPPKVEKTDTRRLRLLNMLHFLLWGPKAASELGKSISSLWQHPALRQELGELLKVLREGAGHLPRALADADDVPLWLHCRYGRDEVLGALGLSTAENPRQFREGVIYDRAASRDAFFITRNKSDRDFSPSTMYEDYAISQELFHWQSQSTTSEDSPTGRRYAEHAKRGSDVLLFVREAKRDQLGTLPYTCLGRAKYVSHLGSRPMSITWRLDVPMPSDVFERMRVAGV